MRRTHDRSGLPVEEDREETKNERDRNRCNSGRHKRSPEETYKQCKPSDIERRGKDIELPGLEHKRLFAREDVADQTTAHGIYYPDENAGGNGLTARTPR
jgi:hypothetical protein